MDETMDTHATRTRICQRCGRELPLGRFARYDGRRKWYSAECRGCRPDVAAKAAPKSGLLRWATINGTTVEDAERRKREIVRMVRSGMTPAVAAKRMGVSPRTATRWCDAEGVERRHRSDPVDHARVVELRESGMTCREVAAALGCSPSTVHAHMTRDNELNGTTRRRKG